MKTKDIEHRVRQITWQEPSRALRERVLSVAVVALPLTWSDRMWFSRAWRLSALGSALVVVALEYLSGAPRSARLVPEPQAMAEARTVDDIGSQLGLPSDVTASLARRALSEAARSRAPESDQDWTTLPEFAPEGPRR